MLDARAAAEGGTTEPGTAGPQARQSARAALVPPAMLALVPGWLLRLGAVGWRVLATMLVAAVALEIAFAVSTVTVSVLLAVVVAATFAPFVLRLRERGWSRTRAAGVVTVGGVLVITATVVVIVLAFVPYIGGVRASLETGMSQLQANLADANVPPDVAMAIEQARANLDQWTSAAIASLVDSMAGVATVAILGGFTLFFLLQDGDKAWVWAMQSATDWRREAISSSGHVALERVGGYLRGTAILAAFHAVADFIFLVLLGVPLAGPLAVFAFVTQFIPYIGGMIATVVLVLVTYATVGIEAVVVLLVLITILNVVQGNILGPVVYQKTVDIHPALVLIAMPAGAAIAGMIGLFAAIPVLAFFLAITGAIVEALGTGPEPPEVAAPRTGEAAFVPLSLDRLGQWSWRLLVAAALGAAAVALVAQFPSVVAPVVLSAIFAATLAGPNGALRRRGWGRSRAAAASIAGGTAAVVIVIAVTLISLIGPIGQIVSEAVAGAGSVDSAASGGLGPLVSAVQEFGGAILSAVAGVIGGLAGLLVALFLSIFLTFYFLRDADRAWERFLARVEGSRRAPVEQAGTRAAGILGGYMLGTGAISLVGAGSQWLIMTILGIPLATPLAVLSFFGGYIPYIGSLLTTGIALLVTIHYGDPTAIAVMVVFTLVINIVQGNFVAPIVYGRVASLHPAVVLLAIPAAGQVAGVVGMFLIVPILGIVAATWRSSLHVLDLELGPEPPPAPVPAPAAPPPPTTPAGREPTPAEA